MSAVTASILVGTKNRVDLGIQPRWIVLLHEANGYAWHLLRLQLSSGDITPQPRFGLLERSAPGTRAGLDQPPGILWRAAAGGDLVGELALMLHLHAAHTPEVLAAVKHLDSLSKRRVDLANLDGRQSGDLTNAIRIARETGGGLYLAVTIMAGSRLTEAGLLELPEWEINLATTVLSRDWVRMDGGHLEVTDFREQPEVDGIGIDDLDESDWSAAPDRPDEGAAAIRATAPLAASPGGTSPGGAAAGPVGPTGRDQARSSVGAAAPTGTAASGGRTAPADSPRPTSAAGAGWVAARQGAVPGPSARGAAEDILPDDDPEPATAEDREQARRFGVRRIGTSGRARVQQRERTRQARDEVLPDEDAGLDSTSSVEPGTWLDDFLRD